MKYILLFIFSVAGIFRVFAQDWVKMMNTPGKNLYEIQKAFEEHWKDRDKTIKGSGYKAFRRWEHHMKPRVYPSGDLSLVSKTWEHFQKFEEENRVAGRASASTVWTAVGPMGALSGLAGGFPRKAGRDNFITFHPTNTSTFWVGSPAGGLWKTTNGGSSWTTTTDNLTVIGCSDLAIDPTNPTTMFLATGDGEAGDTYCIGVLKSTDGGNTWGATGLTFPVSSQVQMRRLIINPSNPLIMLAATNNGIYRTTNGGTSWTVVNGADTYDLEFKPGDPTTVYAAGSAFYRSTNSGGSFSLISSGIPTSSANRMAIAVTPANAALVYVVASDNSTSGLLGVYRSTNSGAAFSTMATSPNILANSCSSPAAGSGQGWYDLAIAASPVNQSEICVGGVNVWQSSNGGSTFTNIGCWIGTGSPPFIHADQHELEYNSSGTLYSTNDGGTYSYTGSSWTDLSNPRNIAQIYKIGLSALSANYWVTGHQDNGSNVYNGTTYNAGLSGDGMDCFVDRTNNNRIYASSQYGGYAVSTNGGTSWSSITSGLTGNAPWVAPWKQDPLVSTRLYAGWSSMFVSNNSGSSWSALSATGGSGDIVEFAIAPSNNQVIYIIHGVSIRKTTNGGSSWSNVTGTIPVNSAAPTFITISPTDPNRVWVTLSGYSSGSKVYYTANGGSSWTNISNNLPNLPANCSVYQPGTNDRVYVGMDVGVYYKDNSTTVWTLYNSGLPNVPISDMEISPVPPGKLRAATYGRGVYEVDPVASNTAPQSYFAFTSSLICSGSSITFTDVSSNSPNAWAWSVNPPAGVTINSSSSQNPSIIFPSAGIYSVSLVASNGFGAGATGTQTLSVDPSPEFNIILSNPTICVNDDAAIAADGSDNYIWLPAAVVSPSIAVNTSQAQQITYTCNATGPNGCVTEKAITVDVSECVGLKDHVKNADNFMVYPNPATNKITVKLLYGRNVQASVEIIDVSGRLVYKQEALFRKDKSEIQINTGNLASGIYTVKLLPETGEKQLVRLVKE